MCRSEQVQIWTGNRQNTVKFEQIWVHYESINGVPNGVPDKELRTVNERALRFML
jgi:hypothetical protein